MRRRGCCGATIARADVRPSSGCARIGGDRIGEERDRHQHEHPLRDLVGAAHRGAATRATAAIGTDTCTGTPARPSAAPMPTNSEMQMPRLATSTEPGCEQRPAHSVLLADQLGQPLAGDRAHPRRHLLDHDQRDRDHHHHPQQVVAVRGADRRSRWRCRPRRCRRSRRSGPARGRREQRRTRAAAAARPAARAQAGAAGEQPAQDAPWRRDTRPAIHHGTRSASAVIEPSVPTRRRAGRTCGASRAAARARARRRQ